MLKRYVDPNIHVLPNSMLSADTGYLNAAASLELFELLHWHGPQQLDAPSSPSEAISLQLLALDPQAVLGMEKYIRSLVLS